MNGHDNTTPVATRRATVSDRWSKRWIIAAVWLVLFAVVVFASDWLATVALVAAFCWVVVREWLGAPRPSIRT